MIVGMIIGPFYGVIIFIRTNYFIRKFSPVSLESSGTSMGPCGEILITILTSELPLTLISSSSLSKPVHFCSNQIEL